MRRLILLAASSFLLFAACGGNSKSDANEAEQPTLAESGEGTEDPAAQPDGTTGEAGESAAGGELSGEDRQALDRMVELTVALVDELNAVGEDCDAMASALDEYAQANGAEIKQLSTHFEGSAAETQKQVQVEMQTAVGPKMEELAPAIMACQEHKGVQEGFQRLQTL